MSQWIKKIEVKSINYVNCIFNFIWAPPSGRAITTRSLLGYAGAKELKQAVLSLALEPIKNEI